MTEIIDPPIGPFSPIGEIEAWIKELEQMAQSPERDDALEQAMEILKAHPDAKK